MQITCAAGDGLKRGLQRRPPQRRSAAGAQEIPLDLRPFLPAACAPVASYTARLARQRRGVRARSAPSGGHTMHKLPLAALVLLLAAPLRAGVIVVDVAFGPGADVHQISEAIALAAPNDTILVRPGLYNAFELTKGLTLVADPDGDAAARGPVRIHDLPAGQTLRIRG